VASETDTLADLLPVLRRVKGLSEDVPLVVYEEVP